MPHPTRPVRRSGELLRARPRPPAGDRRPQRGERHPGHPGLRAPQRGRHREAISCYEQARDIYREFGDRFNEASLLTHLGDTAHAAGEPGTAGEAWENARDIFVELGDTAAVDQLDLKLGGLG
ncbi:tetratricopeptide repeat protein [Kitasatospora gansuensis]